jgi:ribosomal-protein-alanine N-acetyltransferase
MDDYEAWVKLRRKSEKFLNQWEPERTKEFYSKDSFQTRVRWAKKNFKLNKVLHLFFFLRTDCNLIGGLTLDNIRHGPFNSASIGYWLAEEYSNNGFMTEALKAIIHYSNKTLNVTRLEAATLPNNVASRRVLEKCEFKYEGVGQSYLQINGRWRNHVMYANINNQRRGSFG